MIARFNLVDITGWRRYFGQFVGRTRILFNYLLNRPLSSGTIRLASANPFDSPLIDLNYFSNPQDLASFIRIMSLGLQIMESPYMAPYVTFGSIVEPGKMDF